MSRLLPRRGGRERGGLLGPPGCSLDIGECERPPTPSRFYNLQKAGGATPTCTCADRGTSINSTHYTLMTGRHVVLQKWISGFNQICLLDLMVIRLEALILDGVVRFVVVRAGITK